MAKYIALLPVLNRAVVTFGGPVWYLSDEAAFRTIGEGHYSAAHKYGRGLNSSIEIGTKCIQFEGFEAEPSDDELRKLVLCSCYTLTYFSRERPPALKIAVVYAEQKNGTPRVHRVYQVPEALSGALLLPDRFALRPSCKAVDIAALYKVCTGAFDKHPLIETTIERYFSGRAKRMFQERVIDTSIALETMIPGTTELRYRFSLYHSLLSSDIERRQEAYDAFELLYDTRSAIVHGDAPKATKKMEKLNGLWTKVSELMDKSLFYYFVYLKQNDASAWRTHIERVALGYEERISSEEIGQ